MILKPITLFRIIRWWYPQSTSKILKILDKLAPPKSKITKDEAYLELPEDETNFPIEVSASDEDEDEEEASTQSAETSQDEQNSAADSAEEDLE